MSRTRGHAITSERAAISFATGNVTGPAEASAKQTLATLKQLRAMWQSLANSSIADLTSFAASDSDSSKPTAPWLSQVERWYNLLQDIAVLEKEITYQQTLQNKLSSDRIVSGAKYYANEKAMLNNYLA